MKKGHAPQEGAENNWGRAMKCKIVSEDLIELESSMKLKLGT